MTGQPRPSSPGRPPVRALLADDQALLRQTFRILLDATPDMEVVGEAADGQGGGRNGPHASSPTLS